MHIRFLVVKLMLSLCLALASNDFAAGQEAAIQVFGFSAESPNEDASQSTKSSIVVGGPGIAIGAPGMIGSNISFGLGGSPNNSSAMVGLLNNDSIRAELKLTEQQLAGAKKIMDDSSKKFATLFQKSREEGRPLREGIKELIESNQKEAETAIEEILLPEQLKRLRQLVYQIEISQIGLGEALTTGRLSTEIGVTENQKQNLTEKAAAIEAEMKIELAKIRAAAQQRLLAELSTEQRNKAQDLLGKFFMFEEPTMMQRARQLSKQFADQRKSGESTPKKP